MTKFLAVIVAAFFAAASVTAIAQDKSKDKPKAEQTKKDAPKKEPTAAQKKQQERMKQCNMQADEKKLKGDDRKKYMSSCLKPPAKKAEGAKASSEAKKTDKK
jgi:LAS superfamily LD-carboxypeptidase LdcB